MDEGCQHQKRRRLKVGSDGGICSEQATAGDRGSDWGEELDGLVATAGVRRRRYAVGARWHEGTLVLMARQMESPALKWRYGDG